MALAFSQTALAEPSEKLKAFYSFLVDGWKFLNEEGTSAAYGDGFLQAELTDNAIIVPAVFTPREIAWMNERPIERFFQLWTWKESLMKAIGKGLSLESKTFAVLPFAEYQPLPMDGRLWYAASGGIAGYRYSVCTSSPIDYLEWKEMLPADLDCFRRL